MAFKDYLQESDKKKSVAVLFGRMNPPTSGHEENVEGLKKIAHQHNADHLVIASHSHDAKKNPLSSCIQSLYPPLRGRHMVSWVLYPFLL